MVVVIAIVKQQIVFGAFLNKYVFTNCIAQIYINFINYNYLTLFLIIFYFLTSKYCFYIFYYTINYK
jgi:hypothetical protein